jgi:hypothetical protein
MQVKQEDSSVSINKIWRLEKHFYFLDKKIVSRLTSKNLIVSPINLTDFTGSLRLKN